MLASSSGVSSERSAFMNLVRNEIDRLNDEISARGALTLMFQRGNIKASVPSPYWLSHGYCGLPVSFRLLHKLQLHCGVCDKEITAHLLQFEAAGSWRGRCYQDMFQTLT